MSEYGQELVLALVGFAQLILQLLAAQIGHHQADKFVFAEPRAPGRNPHRNRRAGAIFKCDFDPATAALDRAQQRGDRILVGTGNER